MSEEPKQAVPDPAPKPAIRKKKQSRLVGDILTAVFLLALLSGVYLLPPDTSLAQVEETGFLRACVPTLYPPLVTGKPDAPGYDIDLLQLIADKMNVRLSLNVNPSMGKDFNPRNWRINRAQCQLLAGGIVASLTTRSFLDTVNTEIETGWAVVQPAGKQLTPGAVVGVFPGAGGLDRIALSSYLRQNNLTVRLAASQLALAAGLESGQFSAGIAESIGLRDLIGAHTDWNVAWLPGDLGRNPLALGLWKGDLTLKREIAAILDGLQSDGTLADLKAKYGLLPLDAVATLSPI